MLGGSRRWAYTVGSRGRRGRRRGKGKRDLQAILPLLESGLKRRTEPVFRTAVKIWLDSVDGRSQELVFPALSLESRRRGIHKRCYTRTLGSHIG